MERLGQLANRGSIHVTIIIIIIISDDTGLWQELTSPEQTIYRL